MAITKKGSQSPKKGDSLSIAETDETKVSEKVSPAPVIPAKEGVGGRYIELGGGIRVPASD
jgi:hypothetical protein